ncbi:hypothetical protein [Crateriforma conspicua]|uniref:Uncharacterized protein n=1 Tax=Crateriforma conspicua TaxID=2527996 RepID=A0A5C5XR12_9PLAN|nr:hypothetical protein [Crateriforma conspicua]TWT65656.1 hypothetical protein Pan14r_52040 [Crateriforma conspicua]
MIHLISLLLVACTVLAAIHWIYESTIAPTLRLAIRYQLFAVRDELRHLYDEPAARVPRDAFQNLQSELNHHIRYQKHLTISTLWTVYRHAKRHPKQREAVQSEIRWLDGIKNDQFQQLRKRSETLAIKTLVVQSGGLLLYVLPAIALMMKIAQVKRWASITLRAPVNLLVGHGNPHRMMPSHAGI